ncbi:unnamed protein product [Linum trigynum]|uniref:Uncharacterized protein n=1 Tax=Linum trigynum TaxID=586398 RepID=A0AAV2EHZ8_9ROSI
MEDDDQRDGVLLSSSYPSHSTTASTTATTTATSTTMPSPDCGRGGKPKKGLKRFPRVLKAILFETSLAKKIRKRKNAQKGGGGNIYITTPGAVDPTNPLSEQDPPLQNGVVELPRGLLLNSSTPSLTTAVSSVSSSSSAALSNSTFATSSSSSNNSSTNSRSSTANTALQPLDVAAAGEIILLQDHQPNDGKAGSPAAAGKGRYSSNVGLCLVLVSLVVLVFWGKICAIIFTSTWLFFVPHCIPGTVSRIGALYCRKIEPEENYRKNKVVVMEGFVERNRNRCRRWVGGLKGRRGSSDD